TFPEDSHFISAYTCRSLLAGSLLTSSAENSNSSATSGLISFCLKIFSSITWCFLFLKQNLIMAFGNGVLSFAFTTFLFSFNTTPDFLLKTMWFFPLTEIAGDKSNDKTVFVLSTVTNGCPMLFVTETTALLLAP